MKKKIKALLISMLIIAALMVTTFAAEGGVTRGLFIKTMNETFNIYAVLGTEAVFTDINLETEGYYEFMSARARGYISGYPDGSVGGDNAITRGEAAVAIARLADLSAWAGQDTALVDTDIPTWANESIYKVLAAGIMNADEEARFNCNEPLTQDDMAAAVSAIKALKLQGRTDEVVKMNSFDGYELSGRLSTPVGAEKVDTLIIFVHGTGPNTYEMHRADPSSGVRFKYLDTYAEGFTKEGAAFFAYNTRGINLSDVGPYYADIDKELYRQYTPQNIAQDVTCMINELKKDTRFKDAKVVLLGASEGTVIAPLAVAEYGAKADALMLAGYCNDNMREVLEYQLGGEMSFFNYTILFDVPGAKEITKEQFESDPNSIIDVMLGSMTFEDIDINQDGVLNVDDFSAMISYMKDGLFEAVEKGDDQWIEDNMSTIMPPLMTDWFKAHFELPKTEDIMTKVNIPMYIFQGTFDANCPVQGTYDVQARFETLGKKNLTVRIYEGYNHDLNFSQYLYGLGSQAFDDMFAMVETLRGSAGR